MLIMAFRQIAKRINLTSIYQKRKPRSFLFWYLKFFKG